MSPASSPPTPAPPVQVTCPRCKAVASGRFCASCGAPLDGATCAGCGAPLVADARFCHRCGTAVGASATPAGARPPEPRWLATALPWSVAGIALLALIALVAGQRLNTTSSPGPAQPAGAGDAGAFSPGGASARAPDISALTPRERADRLYDRAMRASSEGKIDSSRFFGRMAVDAYRSLPELDLDARYDLGRISETTGALDAAAAQADTILQREPAHLLGLILAISVAERRNDSNRVTQLRRRLLASADAERQRNLPEYERHGREIESALAAASQGAPTP